MPDRESRTLLTAELADFGDGVKILRLAGEIDISSAQLLSTHMEKVARTGLSTVVIDASEVTFMDSTGVHALVTGKRLIHENETKIILVTSAQVRRVLELVFPDPLFAARFDSVDDALRALNEKTPG